MPLSQSSIKMTNLKEKFEAYLAVQESGYYNMIDPRARALASEMNDIEISRADWIYLIANYSELKRELC
jgi:hypothetical protein